MRATPGPVSYTHLDVYKRQVYFDLPTALHCECWLRADGSIDLEVLHLRDVLDDAVAADLAAATIANVEQPTRELG